MLDSIFKSRMFYVPKGKAIEVVFASNLSAPIKTHSVKIYSAQGKNNTRFLNIPCMSGSSGQLPCKFCDNVERLPAHIFRSRKIYVATVYTKSDTPWEDSNKTKHTHSRNLYITSSKILEATLKPFIDKYGDIAGARFIIERGSESKNFNGDLYKFGGYVGSVEATIGERVRLYDPAEIYAPLSPNEITEIMQLINLSAASDSASASSTRNAHIENNTQDEEEIPF